MVSTTASARRPKVAVRRYRRDPERAGLARSFGTWAKRQGVAVHALAEEQCIVLEAVRRFLAWSGPGTLFTRASAPGTPARRPPVPPGHRPSGPAPEHHRQVGLAHAQPGRGVDAAAGAGWADGRRFPAEQADRRPRGPHRPVPHRPPEYHHGGAAPLAHRGAAPASHYSAPAVPGAPPARPGRAAPPLGAAEKGGAARVCRTQYAGAFLLIPAALALARRTVRALLGRRAPRSARVQVATRGLLHSLLLPLVGLRRIYHLETADDPGLGRLTGGRRVWGRQRFGAWLRALPERAVTRFLQRSAPAPRRGPGRGGVVRVSLDEHTVPRWTRKFRIAKGYHTTRNKHMKVEKLFTGFDVRGRHFLRLWSTPGSVELYQVARQLAQRLRRRSGGAHLRLLVDAGAAKQDAAVAALLRATPGVTVLMRAPRHPGRLRRWRALPTRAFRTYREPGPFTGAPPKCLRVAETRTPLKGDGPHQRGVRTIVAVEGAGPAPGRCRKDRWHILYVNDERTDAYALIQEFRQRQHHEQGYRIGVHDLDLDAVPSGYAKRSDPARPAFRPAALTWAAWTKLLAANLIESLGAQLGGSWRHAHPRTLRRTFLARPGTLRETPEALLVDLDWFPEQEALHPLVDALNAARVHLPGPGGRHRRLFLALADELA